MKKSFENISIVGAGNVAHHLAIALHSRGLNINQIWSRNFSNATALSKIVHATAIKHVDEITTCDLVIIAVADDVVAEIIGLVPDYLPVVYTSGSIQLNQFKGRKEIGVFYPLQSFSKSVNLDLSDVPFLIEANESLFERDLIELAKIISTHVLVANSEYRAKIHLAAVWVNNFTNHILHQAWEYASKNNVDFELLKPLLKETIRKIDDDIPYILQTGPAKRGDQAIISKQLNELKGNQRELYRLITESIIETYTNDKL